DAEVRKSLVETVATLAPWLGEAEASAAAKLALEKMARTRNDDVLHGLAEAVAALAVQSKPEEASSRADLLVAAVGSASAAPAPLTGLSLLVTARPLPARFTEKQLVDFLKMPTSPWAARVVLVRQLGQQCGRPFANVWEYIEWANQDGHN